MQDETAKEKKKVKNILGIITFLLFSVSCCVQNCAGTEHQMRFMSLGASSVPGWPLAGYFSSQVLRWVVAAVGRFVVFLPPLPLETRGKYTVWHAVKMDVWSDRASAASSEAVVDQCLPLSKRVRQKVLSVNWIGTLQREDTRQRLDDPLQSYDF